MHLIRAEALCMSGSAPSDRPRRSSSSNLRWLLCGANWAPPYNSYSHNHSSFNPFPSVESTDSTRPQIE
eukprot:scaffold555_cov109-Isochrysis_galbana.AAC.2